MNTRAITLAIMLGTLGGNAIAESAQPTVDASRLTLAMASTTVAQWTEVSKPAINAKFSADGIELKVSERLEKLAAELNLQLESKLIREPKHAM